MKKLYAILMAVVLVLGLSTAAFAAPESFAASVKLEYSVGPGTFTGTNAATVLVDYTRTFSDDISAGLVGKIDFAIGGGVSIVDAYGWIKISNILGMFTLTAATNKVTAAGGNIPGKVALIAGPGIYLDGNFDPLFATFTMNNDGYGLKGTYVDDLFGVGAAYVDSVSDDYGFGVWGSLNLSPFSVKAEYDYNHAAGGNYAYFVEGTYADADLGITAVAGYEGNDGWDFLLSYTSAPQTDKPVSWEVLVLEHHFAMVEWYLNLHNEYMYDAQHHKASNVYGSITAVVVPELLTVSVKGNYLADDDEFSISGNLAVTPTPELTCNVGGGYAEDQFGWGGMYKVYGDVAYQLTPALKLTANAAYFNTWWGDGYQFGLGAAYNFIAGVDGYVKFVYQEGWGLDAWTLTLGVTATL